MLNINCKDFDRWKSNIIDLDGNLIGLCTFFFHSQRLFSLNFSFWGNVGLFFFFVSDAYSETMKVMEKIHYFLGKFLFQLRFLWISSMAWVYQVKDMLYQVKIILQIHPDFTLLKVLRKHHPSPGRTAMNSLLQEVASKI